MNRLICSLLCFSLLLTGCSISGERIKEPVVFYYVREDYRKDMDPVIASEIREASGHSEDLSYLLALYSIGPSQKDLKAALPRNTKIVPTEHTEEHIVLTLSEGVLTMTDADFTLASACLALTCMELIAVPQVTIVCGDRTITMQRDTILLEQNLTDYPQEETK